MNVVQFLESFVIPPSIPVCYPIPWTCHAVKGNVEFLPGGHFETVVILFDCYHVSLLCVCAHRGWPVFSLCQSTTHNNTDNNNHHYDNGTKTCFIIDWYKLNTSKFYQQLTIGKLVKCTPSNLRRNAPCLQAWVNWADKTRYCECQFKQNYIL